jgi:hypothetical protein
MKRDRLNGASSWRGSVSFVRSVGSGASWRVGGSSNNGRGFVSWGEPISHTSLCPSAGCYLMLASELLSSYPTVVDIAHLDHPFASADLAFDP